MSETYKKTEQVANILIIIVAVLIVGLFAQRSLSLKTSDKPDLPKVGDKVSLADFDWSKSRRKSCSRCRRDAISVPRAQGSIRI